ncbi:MAG: hypothetical protein R3F19_23535 [Verrucomicrobiales bacterium]|nr:hypothetical protein [Verrucomicrobiae bacterium]
MSKSYSELDADAVLKTVRALGRRVAERFPDAGLRGVCRTLEEVCAESTAHLAAIRRPIWPLRIASGLLLLIVAALTILSVVNIRVSDEAFLLPNFVDIVQNIIQDLVYLAIGVFFLVRLETTIKRHRVSRIIHQLRSIAHVIDMHQLTKDPHRVLNKNLVTTASSPVVTLTPFLLRRYLDYCSEMLSLTGKIAALYLKDFDDPATVAAVTEIEELTTGLSRKIWQKITALPPETDE